jgi:hypothetical protein
MAGTAPTVFEFTKTRNAGPVYYSVWLSGIPPQQQALLTLLSDVISKLPGHTAKERAHTGCFCVTDGIIERHYLSVDPTIVGNHEARRSGAVRPQEQWNIGRGRQCRRIPRVEVVTVVQAIEKLRAPLLVGEHGRVPIPFCRNDKRSDRRVFDGVDRHAR